MAVHYRERRGEGFCGGLSPKRRKFISRGGGGVGLINGISWKKLQRFPGRQDLRGKS